MLRAEPDRGTVLLLFPAAVMIVFVLGAIVVDVNLTRLRGNELESAAASAANDAIAGLEVSALRSGEGVVIDPVRARRHIAASVEAGPLPAAEIVAITTTVDDQGRTVIAVTLELEVDLVMAPALGDLGEITLRRTARAVILGSDFS